MWCSFNRSLNLKTSRCPPDPKRDFCRAIATNVLQLPEVRIFETVFYRTAYNKAKYLIDICKAKIIVFRGSDRFCKCRSRIPAFLVTAVIGWPLHTVLLLLSDYFLSNSMENSQIIFKKMFVCQIIVYICDINMISFKYY